MDAAAQPAGERRDLRRPVDQQARRVAAARPPSIRRRRHSGPPAVTSSGGASRASASRSSRAISGVKSRRRIASAAAARRVRSSASRRGTGVVGDVEQRGQRREPDQLRLGEADAVLGRELADRLPRLPHRRRPEVEQVHRDLGADRVAALRLLDAEPVGLDARQPAAGLADAARDPLGQLHVVALEVDVPGDEERPGADGHRPEPRVRPRSARSPAAGRSARSRP